MSNIKERYESIKGIIRDNLTPEKVDEFNNVIDFLENNTGWLNAPASTKYHCSYAGGLLEHSVNVAETAIKLKKMLKPDINTGIIAMLGLLHDCGKSNMYVMKEPTEKQKQYGYPGSIVMAQTCFSQHAEISIMLITNFMTLKEEEFAAILYHDQPWLRNDTAFIRNELMTIIQNADYWSCLYLEDGGQRN